VLCQLLAHGNQQGKQWWGPWGLWGSAAVRSSSAAGDPLSESLVCCLDTRSLLGMLMHISRSHRQEPPKASPLAKACNLHLPWLPSASSACLEQEPPKASPLAKASKPAYFRKFCLF
jgi:hypothetical protein